MVQKSKPLTLTLSELHQMLKICENDFTSKICKSVLNVKRLIVKDRDIQSALGYKKVTHGSLILKLTIFRQAA